MDCEIGQRGKKELLEEIVDQFYEVNINDPMIKDFFRDKDVETIKRMNAYLLRSAMTGSELECLVDIKQAHAGLGIQDVHFERYLRNFFCVMRKFKLDEDDIEYILALTDYFRSQIVENS